MPASPLRDSVVVPSLVNSTEQGDLLRDNKPKYGRSFKQCCATFWFTLVTFIMIADYITDVWVIIILGIHHHTLFVGFAVLFLVVANCITSVMYSVHLKTDGNQTTGSVFGCMFLNFPFQIGIIAHRMDYSTRGCRKCYSPDEGEASSHRPKPLVNAHWKFAKLKLIQGMFQSAPELMINLLHILVYGDIHCIQYISAAVSFSSIISGVVIHEKERKEHVRGVTMGISKLLCIFVYKSLVLVARIAAMVHFIYFFGKWLTAIMVPHLLVVFIYFTYLYHQIWKVNYYNISLHSFYSLLAYFPIHNDYRPEGEIVMYYILFMIENVLMVSLPYAVQPPLDVSHSRVPGSQYYLSMTLIVLLCSAAGLLFMSLYYFVFHKSRQTIRHTNLGWLARLCEWSSRPQGQQVLAPPRVNLYGPDEDQLSRVEEELDAPSPVDSGPSTYRTSHKGGYTRATMTDADFETDTKGYLDDADLSKMSSTFMDSDCKFSDTASQPSVLEGDDDDSDIELHDHDTRPLHPVV